MGEEGWGWLSKYESYGRAGDSKEDFDIISYADAKSQIYADFMHASHAFIFARRPDDILWDLYKARGAVLMQMRFDGLLGFPGGLVDPGENPLQGMNRELEEEIALNLSLHRLVESDHVVSFVNKKKNIVLHFYGKEVSIEEFKKIELGNLQASDYGSESMGIIRPPLFTMGDGFRGLPAFLSNNFAGNARQELLMGLEHFNLLTSQEVNKAIDSWMDFTSKNQVVKGVTNVDT
ncbi:hypothetical protein FSP39_008783 [Pinctada imbricata]|uniref:U8 snoRNA-decapping enzyme n=1 Tax=Pinctada imbricata TaxID=66713 RepID=A0AA88XMZ7_PINIB|nr:hypothetical protein FSP39_008783 [Pinctada imbricata]